MTDQPNVGQPHPRLSQEQFEKVREGELIPAEEIKDPDDRPDFASETVPAELDGNVNEEAAQASVEQEDPA